VGRLKQRQTFGESGKETDPGRRPGRNATTNKKLRRPHYTHGTPNAASAGADQPVGTVDPMATPTAFVISPYDPAWRDRGAELAAQIKTALGPPALRVDHIGSTSIPGMAAKPVYDLQVSVADLAAAAEAFDRPLVAFGLTRRPYEQDHVPAGSQDPPELWRKRLWGKAAPGGERINLHCRVAGSPNERLALLFRDWFRAHPGVVPAYARFKLVLAEAVPDIEVYTDVKDPVVDLIIEVAEAWAAETGWSP
jgi:GrpB-like predicted nucleotidyltransferase (UPF0157 family)